MHTFNRKTAATALAAVSVFLLGACSSDDSDASTTPAPGTSATATSGTSAPAETSSEAPASDVAIADMVWSETDTPEPYEIFPVPAGMATDDFFAEDPTVKTTPGSCGKSPVPQSAGTPAVTVSGIAGNDNLMLFSAAVDAAPDIEAAKADLVSCASYLEEDASGQWEVEQTELELPSNDAESVVAVKSVGTSEGITTNQYQSLANVNGKTFVTVGMVVGEDSPGDEAAFKAFTVAAIKYAAEA